MPPRSKVERLPKAVRTELERRLIEGGFGDYDALAAWLSAQGFAISRSTVHRFGTKFEEKAEALRLCTNQAKAIVEANPDDDGAVNEALMRLTQEKMFGLLLDLEVDPKTVDLSKLARAVADIGRATVSQKKWAVEARAKARAELIAEQSQALDKMAKKDGISDDTVRQIRERLGIA